MGDKTGIEWTTHTWNPWQGCRKVSEGCANCYMYREKRRYGQDPAKIVESSKRTLYGPRRWKEPAKVFVCSWSDFFLDDPVANDARVVAWGLIKEHRHLTFQLLTKRPENIEWMLPPDWGKGYSNVWLGTSIEHYKYSYRTEYLRRVPAAVRFVSFEPLLSSFKEYPGVLDDCDWAIAGGESGPNARPTHPDWFRSIRDLCTAAQVPFFFKQWGEWGLLEGSGAKAPVPICFWNETRRDEPIGWLNGFTTEKTAHMVRVGKKASGRLLDGREWSEMPGGSE